MSAYPAGLATTPPPVHSSAAVSPFPNRPGGDAQPAAGTPPPIDSSRVRWAWSMDRSPAPGSASASSEARPNAQQLDRIEHSTVREDLLDVVRLISTNTVQTQTSEPSYTMSLANVHMEGESSRSIAVQAGQRLRQTEASMQVVEGDIAADESAGQDAFGNGPDDPLLTVGPVSSMHSGYLPNCNVPADLYPVFMSDARALGIANRYGYVALPKPAVELPPRRRVKSIAPQEYNYLYGSHNPTLDDHTGRQLHRAHGLWTSQCGFAPQY